MNMEEKEFLRNESVYVRRSAAGNPKLSQYRAVLYLWMFLRFP